MDFPVEWLPGPDKVTMNQGSQVYETSPFKVVT